MATKMATANVTATANADVAAQTNLCMGTKVTLTILCELIFSDNKEATRKTV